MMGVMVREKVKGSGVWWIFINHRGKRSSRKIGKDKSQASEVARKIEAKLVLGDFDISHNKSDTPFFTRYAETWLIVHVPVKCKANTVRDYTHLLQTHVLPHFGGIPVTDINRHKIKSFLMGKLGNGHSRHVVRKIKIVIADVLNLAIDDGIIPANPAHRLGNIYGKRELNGTTETTRDIDPLTREELSLLLDTFKKHFPKHYPFALCLARTGMRLGEGLALQWGDIDFTSKFITVRRSFSSGKDVSTPKSGKSRRVDMSLQLTENLWHLKHEKEREYGDKLPLWVFPNEVGKIQNPHNWRGRVFYKVLDKAELRRIRIHDLRHTYASLLLQSGESMVYVRDQLGHSTIKITVDTYGHLVPGGNREAVDKLDDDYETTPIRTPSAPSTELTQNKDSRNNT